MSKTLQELAAVLDDFEKDYWVAPDGVDEKTRHIVLHLTKLLGKIGTVSEKFEHGFETDYSQVENEVIADLLYFSLSLAKVHEVDLEKAFLNRLEMNRVKIDGWE